MPARWGTGAGSPPPLPLALPLELRLKPVLLTLVLVLMLPLAPVPGDGSGTPRVCRAVRWWPPGGPRPEAGDAGGVSQGVLCPCRSPAVPPGESPWGPL